MRSPLPLTAAAAALVLSAAPAAAQVQAVPVGTGFSAPVFATSAPGAPGTLYVVQQGGQVRALDAATGAPGATLLDLSAIPDSGFGFQPRTERGLLGLAFHPDFQRNGRMYVQYTTGSTPGTYGVRVEQYTVTNGVAGSRRTVLEYAHPDFDNHNAGWIGFNTARGTQTSELFVMTGDGGGGNDPRNNAQNLNTLLGKVLRVDVGRDGLPPAGPPPVTPPVNPPGNIILPGAATPSPIFAYGLRNPYRASFDRGTGDLYIGDVGQDRAEEVNVIRSGSAGNANFGWRLREGFDATPAGGVGGARPADNVDPIFEYLHAEGIGRSITGGYVYRGTARDDDGVALDGKYIFGDYISGKVFALSFDGTRHTSKDLTDDFGLVDGQVGRINVSSFAEDGFGNLYVLGYNGTVYTLAPVPEPAAVLALAAAGLAARGVRRRVR